MLYKRSVYQEIAWKYGKLYNDLQYKINYSYYNNDKIKEFNSLKSSFFGAISEYEKLKDDIYLKYDKIIEESNKEYENKKNNIFNEFKTEIIKKSKLNKQDAEKTFDMSADIIIKQEKDFDYIAVNFGKLEEYITSLSIFKK